MWLVMAFVESLSQVEFSSGETAAARTHWRESLALAGEFHSAWAAPTSLLGLARVALAERPPERCLRLMSAAAEMNRRTGTALDPDLAHMGDQVAEQARRLVGDEAAELAWSEGCGNVSC
jgi:hypothetical protein